MTAPDVAGVLFDLDGTLVDSIELIVACFSHTCRAHLGTVPSREWIVTTIGRSLEAVLEELAPGRAAALLETYREHNTSHHSRLMRPFPAALDVVRRLHARGLPLGVVTSKRRVGALRDLELYGLTPLFTAIVALEDTARHKPQPDPLLEGARRLALPPARVLYVGDSTFDVVAARACAMPVAAALWGAGSAAELRALAPDVALSEPRELLAWLDGAAAP